LHEREFMKFKIFRIVLIILLAGFVFPEPYSIPVQGATSADWNKDSYWYYPWGSSVTHKGIDIFGKAGQPVIAATNGFVIFTGEMGKGGKVVLVLGPKWRLHYYAHLQDIKCSAPSYAGRESVIGSVGNSGNAINTPAHLHYSIATIVPIPWQIDAGPHGLLKMFFLNPLDYLT
jgi:murein DD-endopeptidase MepM/ murein hydrolase activator NlpD